MTKMHQNKPTAPIKYTNLKGQTVLVDVDKVTLPKLISFKLKELAVLQTCVNRSLFNCNCDLDKSVLKGIADNINNSLDLFGDESK
jgi:hypothetical protein